jgi:hypothetical protein
MKSTAPEATVIVGTVPEGHLPPDIVPLKPPELLWVIFRVIMAVPLEGWTNVSTQLVAAVNTNF